MNMSVIRKGIALNVTLGMVREIKDLSIILSIQNEVVEIDASAYTLGRVREIVKVTPFAFLPIHMDTKSILLDVEVPEMHIEELLGSSDEEEPKKYLM